jgi:phospholipid/cholesterol/gamma-HCH transport system substrate-binding protein|tara:strand:- start:2593 stop:3033 length:441 start_codon:yes stop_codon:yes gene_type:complete
MKKNYLESILGFMTLVLAITFLLKFIDVNTENNLTYELRAKFLKAGGVVIGNDVKMRGVKIGVVKNVSLDKDYFAVVDFSVYDNIKVPVDSTVKIASDGILGNKYLSITPNADSKNVLKINEEIKKVEDYESIEDQVSKIIFLATQ